MAIRRSLLLCAGLAALLGGGPLWIWLDLPLRLILPSALLFSLWCEVRGRAPLAPRLATTLTLAGFLWYAAQFSRTEIVAPAAHLLALLLALRLATEKSGRNLLQLFVLSLLSLAASSLYSLSGAFLVFLVAEVVCVACGLVFLCFSEEGAHTILSPSAFRQLLKIGIGLPLVSLVLMPPLFFILPRTQIPLWNVLNREEVAISGMTDRIEPGSVSSLASDRRVALRVECERLPPGELYWRAIVLNTPEGKGWVRRAPPPGERSIAAGGKLFPQTIYLEPRPDRFIPTLDRLFGLSGITTEATGDGLLFSRQASTKRQSGEALSRLGGTLRLAGPIATEFYLTLPDTLSARVRDTAAQVATAGDARTRIEQIEGFFLRQGLTYSRSVLPGGDDPLDDFLFEKKSGYCEHFATAFVTLLRLAGVPSRLAGGYYGGEYSEWGGYYVVTEERAHVWVEALVGEVWERIDPTTLALNAASVGTSGRERLSNWSRWLDAANYYWNRTVITYDLDRQIDWLRSTGDKGRQWRLEFDYRRWGLGLLLAGTLVVALYLVVRSRLRRREDRLLQDFLRLLRREGIDTTPPAIGLRRLAARSAHPLARDFAARYNAIVFHDRRMTPQEGRELQELLRRLKKELEKTP